MNLRKAVVSFDLRIETEVNYGPEWVVTEAIEQVRKEAEQKLMNLLHANKVRFQQLRVVSVGLLTDEVR